MMGDQENVEIRQDCVEDYKTRMYREYWQLRERNRKLQAIIEKALAGRLDFELSCPLFLLMEQHAVMSLYESILETRAEIECIDLGTDYPA